MKKFLRLIVTIAVLAPAVVSAASFEGKVSFKVTSNKGQPQEINYNIKGDKLRIDIPGQKGSGGMIMDTGKKEMIMIMDEQKMYMTMAFPDPAAQATEKKGEAMKYEKKGDDMKVAKKGEDVQLVNTGETEKILGFTATKYVATHQDMKTEMWLAEGLGTFMGFNQQNPMAGRRGGTSAQGWERALAGKDLFPLRVVGMDKGGKENFRMEATAINKQTLPESLFVPPADYQKFDMGGMMKGIMQGIGR